MLAAHTITEEQKQFQNPRNQVATAGTWRWQSLHWGPEAPEKAGNVDKDPNTVYSRLWLR